MIEHDFRNFGLNIESPASFEFGAKKKKDKSKAKAWNQQNQRTSKETLGRAIALKKQFGKQTVKRG